MQLLGSSVEETLVSSVVPLLPLPDAPNAHAFESKHNVAEGVGGTSPAL